MNSRLPLFSALALTTCSLQAQVSVVNPVPALGHVVEVRAFNGVEVQRQLS